MNFTMFWQSTHTTLGVLTLDVLVTENLKLPSEATKYPVEDGSEDISDHITRNNEELSITGSVTSAQAFSISLSSGCLSRLQNAVDQLRSMHKARKPVKIVTGLGQYTDMAFTSLSINRSNGNQGGNWIDINADLRKIKKVALKQADLPPDKAAAPAKGKTGTSEQKGGKSSDQPPDDTSTLKTMKNGYQSGGIKGVGGALAGKFGF